MPIPGNPRVFARDIADGFFVFNQATCRQFALEELKTISRHLEQVGREIRGEQIPLENVVDIQRKNLRLGRVNTALLFMRHHAKRFGVTL